MTKAKSRKAFLLAGLLSVVLMLFGTIGAYTAARAYASEGVEASTDTVTGYYMTIPLAGCEGKGFKNRQDKLTLSALNKNGFIIGHSELTKSYSL